MTHFNSLLSDNLHPKRRRTDDSKGENESEQEEHSHSLSQHSSSSQSDQEQTPVPNLSSSATDPVLTPHSFNLFKQKNQSVSICQCNDIVNNQLDQRSCYQRSPQHFHFMEGEHQRHPKPEGPGQFLQLVHTGREKVQYSAAEHKPLAKMQTLVSIHMQVFYE